MSQMGDDPRLQKATVTGLGHVIRDLASADIDVPGLLERGEIECVVMLAVGEALHIARISQDKEETEDQEAHALIQQLLNAAATVAADHGMDIAIFDATRGEG